MALQVDEGTPELNNLSDRTGISSQLGKKFSIRFTGWQGPRALIISGTLGTKGLSQHLPLLRRMLENGAYQGLHMLCSIGPCSSRDH